MVTGALKERLLAPDRLMLLLQGLVDQQTRQAVDASGRLVALQDTADDAKTRLQRPYQKIASGVLAEDDVLKEVLDKERADLEKANTALSRARLQAAPSLVLDTERMTHFGRLMSERLDEVDVNAKRGYIACVVSAIEVHDERICIMGQTDALKHAVTNQIEGRKVRGFVRKWRARHDIDGHCHRWKISLQHPSARSTRIVQRAVGLGERQSS